MSSEETNHPKHAFVPQADRPEVRSTPVGDQLVSYKIPDKWSRELERGDFGDLFSDKDIKQLFEFVSATSLGFETLYSINCSGAIVIQDRDMPEHRVDHDPIHSIWATWTVPKVNPPAGATPGEWRCASWVGLDGGVFSGGSSEVLQAGIAQSVILNGTGNIIGTTEAFFGWDSKNIANTQTFREFAVEPGDLIHVKVQYLDEQGKGVAYFTNYTKKKFRLAKDIPNPSGFQFSGDTGEWMMERPCGDRLHEKYYQLPDFGTMEFTHAGGLTVGDVQISPERAHLCRMGTDDGSRRIISDASKNLDTVRITWRP